MADLKIYNNGENKVLMSAGDRIIRQPYEFGKGFVNQVGLNNYIVISDLDIPDVSKAIWHNKLTIQFGTVGSYLTHNNDNYNFNCDTTQYYAKNSLYNNIAGSISVGVGHNALYFLKSQSPANNEMRVSSLKTAAISSEPTSNIKKIYLGAAKTSSGDGLPNLFNRSANVVGRATFFNRPLSNEEWLYYVNNRLGSAYQSTIGILIDMLCDKAEILDFSVLQDGSDLQVGCRDYSGFNRHGQIMNLPVGSLEDQLAFANANLFVPFIQ